MIVMKKLKVIEAGRILTSEELSNIYGGDDCPQYIGCNTHDDCLTANHYVTCRMRGYGYETNGDVTACNIGSHYASCTSKTSFATCSTSESYGSSTGLF